ncbi:MAG: hypothetical protein ACRDJ1_00135 [Actinomycetota bacterium]
MPAKKKTAAKKPATKKRATAKRPSARRARSANEVPFREEPSHEHDFGDEAPPASPFMPGMSTQCLVCPICMSLYALQQSRPEAMQHLMTAGHELFLAFRALVEAQGERWEHVNTLQRISVR